MAYMAGHKTCYIYAIHPDDRHLVHTESGMLLLEVRLFQRHNPVCCKTKINVKIHFVNIYIKKESETASWRWGKKKMKKQLQKKYFLL